MPAKGPAGSHASTGSAGPGDDEDGAEQPVDPEEIDQRRPVASGRGDQHPEHDRDRAADRRDSPQAPGRRRAAAVVADEAATPPPGPMGSSELVHRGEGHRLPAGRRGPRARGAAGACRSARSGQAPPAAQRRSRWSPRRSAGPGRRRSARPAPPPRSAAHAGSRRSRRAPGRRTRRCGAAGRGRKKTPSGSAPPRRTAR